MSELEGAVLDTSAAEAAPFANLEESAIDAMLDANDLEKAGQPAAPANPQQAAPQQVQPRTSQEFVPAPSAQPTAEEKLIAMEKRVEAMAREAGQNRATQAKLAELEKIIKQSQQTAQQAAAPNNNLTPEQREAQKNFAQYVKQAAQELIDEKYGNIIKFAEANQASEQQQAETREYIGGFSKLCEEFGIPTDEVRKSASDLVNATKAASDAGDQAASARLAQILGPGGQSYLFALALREREKGLQAQGAQFQQSITAKAAAAAQTVRSGARPSVNVSKKLADMSPQEMEKLTEAEIDAKLDEEKIR